MIRPAPLDTVNMPRSLPLLVVDDTEICRLGTALMLEQFGFKTKTADNGFEALNKLENVSYGAVIMDYDMEDMTGAECTEQLRKMETGTNRDIPVICMSSNDGPVVREKCLKAGMVTVLEKTCPAGRVLEVLEKVLCRLPASDGEGAGGH